MKTKSIKWWVWPITAYLSLVLCLHLSLVRGQDTNNPPDMVANCEDIPKQKGNIAFGIIIAIMGAIFFYGIYKCAKKIDQKPPPPPPPPITPPPGYGTNCNPNHPDWPCTNLHPITRKMSLSDYSGASDFSGVRDSMTGLAHSSPNAFISLYDWSTNTTALDDDLVPYNMWYEGVLPVRVTADFVEWSRSLTVTGWISPSGVKSVYYDEGVPLCTNFVRTVDPWAVAGYDQTTNVDVVDINPVRLNVPQRFFLTISTNAP